MALNTYQLVISCSIGPQFAQNVLHYQFDDAGFPTTKSAAEALIQAWDTANRTNWKSLCASPMLMLSYKALCISAPGGFEAFSPITGAANGIRGAISVTGVSAVIIHYPVNLAFGRGRTFLPGLAEADCDSGIYTSAFRSAVEGVLATLFDPITLVGGGGPTATFGYFQRPAKVFRALVNSILSENVGTMRRRMRPV